MPVIAILGMFARLFNLSFTALTSMLWAGITFGTLTEDPSTIYILPVVCALSGSCRANNNSPVSS
ncbi:MAG: hypothetical protein IKP58_17300 [Victivallales bacterium]|nr:hypothetical protein [Victivallales bacterium]